MVVSVPLHYDQLAPGVTGEKMHACLESHYAGSRFVSVRALNEVDSGLERGAFLRPDTLNDTNELELSVYANDEDGIGVARGAAGQPGEGRLGRGGAEHEPRARPGRGLRVVNRDR